MENWKVFLTLLLATAAIIFSIKDFTKNRAHVIKLQDSFKTDGDTLNSTNSTIERVISVETYNATVEIEKRRENLIKWCTANKKHKVQDLGTIPGLNRLPWLTRYISKFGVSTGKQNFWACFTPKCASQLG